VGFSRFCFHIIRACVDLCYPKVKIVGLENLPNEPCIVAGNHSHMHGPLVGELRFPGERAIWCASEVMTAKEVPDYAMRDFWPYKPKSTQWFYRILSHLITPLCVCLFTNARTIPVYRDRRLMQTFRQTLDSLQAGKNVIIFPERDAPHNHVLYDFQTGFVDIARTYYQQTGKMLAFVPMYLAPKLRRAYLGQPVYFDPTVPVRDERRRVCDALMDAITDIACGLPRHLMIPYANVPKTEYRYNRPDGGDNA